MDRRMLYEMQVLAGVRSQEMGARPDLGRGVLSEESEAAYRMSYPGYAALSVLTRAVFDLHGILAQMKAELDSFVFSDGEYAKRAAAMRDGPVASLHELVLKLGYAIDNDFTTGWRYRRVKGSDDEMPTAGRMPVLVLHAFGELAEVAAIGQRVKPKLARMREDSRRESLGGGSLDGPSLAAITKAFDALTDKGENLLERISKGVEDFAAEIARNDAR